MSLTRVNSLLRDVAGELSEGVKKIGWDFDLYGDMETCSMCGDLCAIKVVNELFREKKGKGKKK